MQQYFATPLLPPLLTPFFLPFSREREKGPGDEGRGIGG